MTGIRKRSTKPGHGQSKMTKDMTAASIRDITISKLDADYAAIVGGKKSLERDRKAQSSRYDITKAEFRRRSKKGRK